MTSLLLDDKNVTDRRQHSVAQSSRVVNVFDHDISHVAEKYRGSAADEHDMTMLGKKQVLRVQYPPIRVKDTHDDHTCIQRNFNFITMLGFASTCIASWEGILTYLSFVLTDGGTALLFWGFVACAIGQTLVYASLAEMASMSPTAGGQYHWVSEFATPRQQKILSYFSGWLTAIGWQTYLASVCFLVGTIIQGLIILNDPTYVPRPWHGTLLAIAVVAFSIAFNTILAAQLPTIEGGVLVLHMLGFLGIVVTLWVMAPHGQANVVLLQFTNGGGWPTTGLSAIVGLLAPQAVLVGYDCSVRMSEEIKDASMIVPQALMASVLLNVTLVFVVVVTLCFTIGDPAEVLKSSTGYPFIQVFYNATNSYAGTGIMTAVIIIMLSACGKSTTSIWQLSFPPVSEVAAASRQIWSFARDAGLPGHSWLSHVSPNWNIPLPAVAVSVTISALLALINIGSTAALNAITSLAAVATLVSYYLTIGCLVHRRLRGPALPPHRWSLGRSGLFINIAALAFLTPLIFFLTWPLVTPVQAETMNWSSVMLCGTLIIAATYYVVKGRNEYVGPVVHVRREE